jgi:hypothetical protein
MFKTAVCRVLVNLGDPLFPIYEHQVNLGFLATSKWPKDLLNEALLYEWVETLRYFHGGHGAAEPRS